MISFNSCDANLAWESCTNDKKKKTKACVPRTSKNNSVQGRQTDKMNGKSRIR